MNTDSKLSVGTYALATGLIGFSDSTLRVYIARIEGAGVLSTNAQVFVRTADLRDAGTPLVLDASQIKLIDEAAATVTHKTGLVSFEV